ncbi:MAG: sigma 54-dependent Fis family transcriptional regulator [Deltaproteobacteria bacterium]|nr:sigma 54-dependent Fis family transcriptional regulator [Deltaproteobacteria bacterium]
MCGQRRGPEESMAPTDLVGAKAPPLPSRLQLEVVDGPDRGRALVLARGVYVVGKSTGCDLVLSDRTVSRRHLEVNVTDHRVLCRDLDSKNGSFHDGTRFGLIDAVPGATLTIGTTTLRLASGARPPDATGDAVPLAALVGDGARMREVGAQIRSAAGTDAPVLLLGETGTGKEVCAAAIHRASARRDGPFVVCDLSALSRSVIESELFGHVRGAFTSATADRAGAFAEARGGTIFIDELGELEAELQPRLLRALDRHEVKPIGANRFRPVDVRVIAATQRPLEDDVRAGRFRRDLYYRLAVLRTVLPPLRERKEDIPALVEHFVARFRPGRSVAVPAATLALLREYDWPGNVRELRNTVERALAMAPDATTVEPRLLGLDLGDGVGRSAVEPDRPFHEAKDALVRAWEREYLSGLLRRTDGNVSAAARRAGVDRMHLHRLLRKHGLTGGGD